MTATDLVAWCKLLGFADEPALSRCEIAAFRYRVLHVAARITHGARSTHLRIDRTWRWTDERNAGGTKESPGRTAVYMVPGEIPPGGHMPFTYRSDTPLPQRSDGSFETQVSVVGLEQVG